MARSTRSARSATSTPLTLGCGICAASLAVGAELAAAGEDVDSAPADLEGDELGEGLEQPATTRTVRTAVAPLAPRFMSVSVLAVVGTGVAGTVVIGRVPRDVEGLVE